VPGHGETRGKRGDVARSKLERRTRVAAKLDPDGTLEDVDRLALLGRLLDTLVPGESAPRVNRLVTGLPGLESAAPVEALES